MINPPERNDAALSRHEAEANYATSHQNELKSGQWIGANLWLERLMPTIHKPQLDHVGFKWSKDAGRLHEALVSQAVAICHAVGSRREPHDAGPSTSSALNEEESELIRRCSGAISLAAARQIDAGYKAPNTLIATLNEIEKNPSLILERDIEPEALGCLGSSYQRNDERPGTFWFDVFGDEGVPVADPERVKEAASRAIDILKAEASKGRPKNVVMEQLAFRLIEIYSGFNDKAGRRSILSWKDDNYFQIEDSRFVRFLELVIAPLNQFYADRLVNSRPKPVSATQLARVALRNRRPKS
jgi:hypothetical protein